MEEAKDGVKDGQACCDKKKCCGGKALIALALLAVGATGGYFAARGCAMKCAPQAVSAPAQK